MDATITHHNTLRTSILQAVLGGVVGTLPMSLVMYLRPYMGLPDWPVPHVLAGMLHVGLWGGWMAHFLVGVIFAVFYLFTFNRLPIRSKILKGALFGIPAYGAAFSTWLLIEALHGIHFDTYKTISYPYLIEHIIFAAAMAPFIPVWSRDKEQFS